MEMRILECFSHLFHSAFSFIQNSEQFFFVENEIDNKRNASVFEKKILELSLAKVKMLIDSNLPLVLKDIDES